LEITIVESEGVVGANAQNLGSGGIVCNVDLTNLAWKSRICYLDLTYILHTVDVVHGSWRLFQLEFEWLLLPETILLSHAADHAPPATKAKFHL
jgi:hypothetical protein